MNKKALLSGFFICCFLAILGMSIYVQNLDQGFKKFEVKNIEKIEKKKKSEKNYLRQTKQKPVK